MNEIVRKIPVSIVTICILVLTVLLSISVIRGDSLIDIWGIKIQPIRHESTNIIGNLPVGTIVPSYLSPQQMKENYGDEWILANGEEIPTSTLFYKVTGKTKLPDLRGVFVRGLNVNRNDGNQDPDGQNRQVGDFQRDDFLKHDHSIHTAGVWGRSFKGEDGEPRTAHKQDGNTEDKGGQETRPRNVALFYYIKIR